MSLSRPTAQNPAVRFYDWSGSRGQLEYWDKEKSERIAIKLPFKFIVLDELHTITGYSDPDQSGFWSNEVRTTREDFTVRTKRGVKYVGPYKNDQGIVQTPQGSKYAKSIYIAFKNGDEWVIGNIKASGVALSAWIDHSSKHKTEGNITAITGSTEGSKGATTFQIPTLAYGGSPDEATLEIATDLDTQLQGYLDTYLAAPKYDDNAEPVNDWDDVGKATPEQIADFEARKAAAKQPAKDASDDLPPAKPDVVIEDIGDEPINLDDIPF
jgi:hypothetical protein